jgi:hypothetical protein
MLRSADLEARCRELTTFTAIQLNMSSSFWKQSSFSAMDSLLSVGIANDDTTSKANTMYRYIVEVVCLELKNVTMQKNK